MVKNAWEARILLSMYPHKNKSTGKRVSIRSRDRFIKTLALLLRCVPFSLSFPLYSLARGRLFRSSSPARAASRDHDASPDAIRVRSATGGGDCDSATTESDPRRALSLRSGGTRRPPWPEHSTQRINKAACTVARVRHAVRILEALRDRFVAMR